MTVRIEVSGETIGEAARAFGPNLQLASSDDLLAELRDRLASESPPRVVKVLSFYDDEVQDELKAAGLPL